MASKTQIVVWLCIIVATNHVPRAATPPPPYSQISNQPTLINYFLIDRVVLLPLAVSHMVQPNIQLAVLAS